MATDVIMPQMGESITEGTITRWLVKVGDTVERDQPLFEISTDKVDAEIPSPADGVLLEIRFDEGDTVQVDDVVGRLGDPDEDEGDDDAEDDAGVEADEPEAAGSAAGERESEGREPEGDGGDSEEESASRTEDADEESGRARTHSSPVVRKMAAEHDIDLADIDGTGIHGRVTKRDVERYLEERSEQESAGEEESAGKTIGAAAPAVRSSAREAEVMPAKREPSTFSVPAYRDGDDVEIVQMSKIREITAAHMRYSKDTSAHVTTVFHMDLSKVAKVRDRAKRRFAEVHGTKLTYMPFIFRAVAAALKANPKLNASVDGSNIVFKKDVNIGMAVALEWGLIVPVIRNADQLNLVGLAKTANDLADRARGKKLSPDEVQGGTFTVTNPGVFGSLFGTPIINQPQVAILGLGVIEKRPVVDTDADGNDMIMIKPMSYFAITYDHRLVDGADADEFMNDVKRTLIEESWSELDPFL
jgi:pyruvate dehydrogenase E2 component (dihydrolipoamide acetyltransferase)